MTSIPAELQALLGMVILFLVVNGLKGLSELLGKDLSGCATIIAGILTATFLFFMQQIIAAVPLNYQPIINSVFSLLVLILSAMGFKRMETMARSK
jgi:hypothetical protein